MAFQIGEIKISGTIDNLSFYKSVFGWLVRRKGGPTRKQFKKSPSFARSRENSNEFTLCSKAASAIRKLVINHTTLEQPNPKPETIKPETLYHRLIKLMRLLADADPTSPRGQRDPLKGMNTTQGKTLLENFQITEELDLYTILISAGFFQASQKVTDPDNYRDIEVNPSNKRSNRKRKFRFISCNPITLNNQKPKNKRNSETIRNPKPKTGTTNHHLLIIIRIDQILHFGWFQALR